MITPYNILKHEIIGLMCRVSKATSDGYLVSGKITDETKNTFTISTDDNKKKIIPKNCAFFELELPQDALVEIDGKILLGTPGERINKKIRVKF